MKIKQKRQKIHFIDRRHRSFETHTMYFFMFWLEPYEWKDEAWYPLVAVAHTQCTQSSSNPSPSAVKAQETHKRKMKIVRYTTENERKRERKRKSVYLRPKAYYISCLIIVTLQSQSLKQIILIIWHSLSLSYGSGIVDFQCCFVDCQGCNLPQLL